MVNRLCVVLHLLAIIFMLCCFALLLVSMLTHAWRGIEEPLNGVDIYHGLWSQCFKQPNQDAACTRTDDDTVEAKEVMLANAICGLLAGALFFTFIGCGLSVLNLCIQKKNAHASIQIIVAVMLGVAFICGISSLGVFTSFSSGDTFKYPIFIQGTLVYGEIPYEWRYSWKLGWAGSVLLVVPAVLTIVEAITYKKELA